MSDNMYSVNTHEWTNNNHTSVNESSIHIIHHKEVTIMKDCFNSMKQSDSITTIIVGIGIGALTLLKFK